MLPSTDLLAWGVMITVSIVGVMLMIGVLRSALGARRAVAAVQAAAARFIQSDDYKVASLLRETADGQTRRSLKFLSEVAAGQIQAIRDRIAVFVDSEFRNSNLRGVNACARMLPFAGLFGTVLGLLAQFSVLGDGDGKSLDLSAVGLALRTTAAALFGTMTLLAVSSFFGEPAIRRLRDAYMLAAYLCHDHCQFLREASRSVREAPAPVFVRPDPSPRAARLEKQPAAAEADFDLQDDDACEKSTIYDIKPEPSARNHRSRHATT